MATDYANDLLSPREALSEGVPSAPPRQRNILGTRVASPEDMADRSLGAVATRDYASMLAGKSAPRPPSFDDLPIVNRDTFKGTAGFKTLSKAAMVDDPETRLRIFAKDLFPDLPEQEAIQRVGQYGNEVIYLGKDDQLYRATPPGVRGWGKELAAGTVGNAPAVIGGTVGGVLGAAGGPPGIVVGSALGAAGGKGYGKVAANLAFDEPQTVGGNIGSMLTEGAFSGAGALLGVGLSKWLERNLARDIGRLNRADVAGIERKASRLGVELTPAEKTNLPSLKGQQKMLSNMPQSSDVMDEFATRRAGQASTAVGRFLDSVSDVGSAEEAGALAREAAKGTIERAVQERSAAAKPLYESAFQRFEQMGGIPDGDLVIRAGDLMKRPAMNEAGKRAVKLAANEGTDLTDSKKSLLGMHYIKLALDDMIESAGMPTGGTGSTYKRGLVGLKDELVRIMDDLSPDYAEARKVYAHFSPTVKGLREGAIGRLAEMGDERLVSVARRMFDPSTQGPLSVSQARKAIEAESPEAWQALKRAVLQEQFEKAGQQFASNRNPGRQGAGFWAMYGGNRRQMDIMQEAMKPGEFQAFRDLLDVLEAASRVPGTGSDTAWNEAAKRTLESQAGGRVAKSIVNPLGIPGRLAGWITELRMGRHAEKLAEIVTSPEAMQQLKQLKQLSPTDQRFIAGLSSLAGVSVSPGGGDPTREQLPPAYR